MKRTHKTLRTAKTAARAVANQFGRRVFVQRDHDGGVYVLSGEDGRGPLWIGLPFWTVYPDKTDGKVGA